MHRSEMLAREGFFLNIENPMGNLDPHAPQPLTRYQSLLQILKPKVDFLLVSDSLVYLAPFGR